MFPPGWARLVTIPAAMGSPVAAMLNHKVLSLHVAEVAQTRPKHLNSALHIGRGASAHKSNPIYLSWLLLSERRKRCERTRSKREHNLAACNHLITLVARTSIEFGNLTPRALAVFMLMTSSNLIARSIGKSPGFAPLRILST